MRLPLRDRELDLSAPVLMGIVNATPDSFSDRQGPKDPGELAERGLRVGVSSLSRFFKRHGITRKKRPDMRSSRTGPTS